MERGIPEEPVEYGVSNLFSTELGCIGNIN